MRAAPLNWPYLVTQNSFKEILWRHHSDLTFYPLLHNFYLIIKHHENPPIILILKKSLAQHCCLSLFPFSWMVKKMKELRAAKKIFPHAKKYFPSLFFLAFFFLFSLQQTFDKMFIFSLDMHERFCLKKNVKFHHVC